MFFDTMVFQKLSYLIMVLSSPLNFGLPSALHSMLNQDQLLPIINSQMAKSNVLTLLLNNISVATVPLLKVNGVFTFHFVNSLIIIPFINPLESYLLWMANYGFHPNCTIDSPPVLLQDNASILFRNWSAHFDTLRQHLIKAKEDFRKYYS